MPPVLLQETLELHLNNPYKDVGLLGLASEGGRLNRNSKAAHQKGDRQGSGTKEEGSRVLRKKGTKKMPQY
jgi:hypothetical protein